MAYSRHAVVIKDSLCCVESNLRFSCEHIPHHTQDGTELHNMHVVAIWHLSAQCMLAAICQMVHNMHVMHVIGWRVLCYG